MPAIWRISGHAFTKAFWREDCSFGRSATRSILCRPIAAVKVNSIQSVTRLAKSQTKLDELWAPRRLTRAIEMVFRPDGKSASRDGMRWGLLGRFALPPKMEIFSVLEHAINRQGDRC